MPEVRAFAPGRVNLIGEHTDYTGGWCLPIAVSMGITVTGTTGGDRVEVRSDTVAGVASVPLDVTDPAAVQPTWARYVAGVVTTLRPQQGFRGEITSDLPDGAGLSSSAALEVAVALALGADDDPVGLAHLCQRAEQLATGVPCGILDQLASARGVTGHALLLDCETLAIEEVPVPADMELRVVHSGQRRELADSAYATRRAECEAAAARIGPLRVATLGDLDELEGAARRRARHVITENARVHAAASALRTGDVQQFAALVDASHRSLRDDFEVSTSIVDDTVTHLRSQPGVLGVRMIGGGFGGCVLAVTEPGALTAGWAVTPNAGARRQP